MRGCRRSPGCCRDAPRRCRWPSCSARRTAASTRMRGDSIEAPRLRAYSFDAFVLVGILPVLLLSATNGELSATRQESEGGARLHEAVTALSEHVDDYVDSHRNAMQSLAR